MSSHPFEPNRTKMPKLGICRDRSSMAVTSFFPNFHQGALNDLRRLWMEIAMSGDCDGVLSSMFIFRFLNILEIHERLV